LKFHAPNPIQTHNTPINKSTNQQINKSSNTFGFANLKKNSKMPAGGFGLFIETV